MLRCSVIAALLTLVSGAASAQTVRLEQYRHPAEPKFETFNHLYLKGVVDGLIASTMAQPAKDRFFCLPPTLAITLEQSQEIMLRYAEKKQLPGNTLIAIPMLGGLRETYPCPKE